MSDPITLTSAFLLGFFSTLHCIGMCGGIIGALSLSLPVEIRNNKPRLFSFILSYNIGRLISYGTAGLIAGAVGTSILQSTGFDQGHVILQGIGVAMMVAIGLYLTGWLPQLARVEKLGIPIWKRLEPIGKKLVPVASIPKAMAYGLIWGWLPCGLVYFVLIWALTSGDAWLGALTMLAFGAGTLPTLITAGFMTSWITRFAHSTRARQIVGLLIIVMAIGSLFIPMEHHHH
ncbi:Heavy-metal-associated domain (N-terminus) and membrane-bounded cytochrome biogenesis cycZ-like domain, possible membrane copper tolerance protein [hydrothermal vent metagenome]|uniref:Heavy-metal-associated domain (N-terminus) and membrane-bounded cytochrome biogenesis cycZ-like domain, possible membrane copper tolerance protein n=1 Tax=hydrothermal vent metagenome TaxID=652676 RepID=A0A3B0X203_9ZZZZ